MSLFLDVSIPTLLTGRGVPRFPHAPGQFGAHFSGTAAGAVAAAGRHAYH